MPNPNIYDPTLDIVGQAAYDQSGYSVSLSADGTRVAIGAPYNDANTAGITRVFQLSGTVGNYSWQQLGADIVGQYGYDKSGWSVSLSADGTRVAIGAPDNNPNGLTNAGNTRIFQWDSEHELWTQVLFDPLYAGVCFVKGTPVQTDQGVVSIELIDPEVNTINGGEKIVGVTRTVSYEPDLVKISKGTLGYNIPTLDTIVTNNHIIMHEGNGIRASELLDKYTGVTKVPYTSGDILYNVLLEYHGGMVVNGLLVETLDPENIVADLYKLKEHIPTQVYKGLISEINRKTKNNNQLISVN
jgi:hypothetical protein